MSRRTLFDLAVNRALTYAHRVGQLDDTTDNEPEREELRSTLEVWYLKTRFAYRVPLDEVVQALLRYPGGKHYWNGGKDGGWVEGEPPTP